MLCMITRKVAQPTMWNYQYLFGGFPTSDTEYIYLTGLTPGQTYYLRIWDDNYDDLGAVYLSIGVYI